MSAGVCQAPYQSPLGRRGSRAQEKCLAAVSIQGPASLASLPQPSPRLLPLSTLPQRVLRLQAVQDAEPGPARRGRPRKTASPMPETVVKQQPVEVAVSKGPGRPRKTGAAPAVATPAPVQKQTYSTPTSPPPPVQQQQQRQQQEEDYQPKRGRPRRAITQAAQAPDSTSSQPGSRAPSQAAPQAFDDFDDMDMMGDDLTFLDEQDAGPRFSSQRPRGNQQQGPAPARSLSDRFGSQQATMPRGQAGGSSFLRTPQATEEDLDAGLEDLDLQGVPGASSLPERQTAAPISTQRGATVSPTGLPYGGVAAGISDNDFEKAALRRALGIDIYERQRREQEPAPAGATSHLLKSGSAREFANARLFLTEMYWRSRRQERDAIHMAAWAAHHAMREKAVNVYANSRRIAGLMSAFEEDDFRLREEAPSHIAPWARSELVFREEYPEFQEYLRTHSEEIVKMLPKEAEEEDLDLMDEALFLMRPDEEDSRAAQESEQSLSEQHLMDSFLEGTLPGATLNDLAATYAEDIFSDYAEADDAPGAGGLDEEGAGVPAADGSATASKSAKQGLGDDDEFGVEVDDADDLA